MKVTVGALGAIDSARDGTGLEALPIACTLEAGDLKERVASIRELARDALLGFEREGMILSLRDRTSAAERVREMVNQEEHCCAFLRFSVLETPNPIAVTTTSPEAAADAAWWMFFAVHRRCHADGWR